MKLHRALVLAVLILGSLAFLALMTASAVRQLDGHSLASFAVVLAVAAVAGLAFSWRRYFPRRS